MTGTFDRMVTAAYAGKTAAELAEARVDALKGVSAEDARKLDEALGIKTVGDLAASRFVRAAQAIRVAAAGLDHDPGPDPWWTAFFARAPLAFYQDYPKDFRLDFGPVYYRGRLDGTARLLVVGQDPAANELVANRILVGASGQRVQRFLARLGVTRDYVMVNTFLYPVYGQVLGNKLETLSHTDPLLSYRNELFDHLVGQNPLQAIIAVGGAAKDALDHWPKRPAGLHVEHITHPSAQDNKALLANWSAALVSLGARVNPEPGAPVDTTPYGADWTSADHIAIPRFDLPFGTPAWQGEGSHASRAETADGKTDSKRILWKAP